MHIANPMTGLTDVWNQFGDQLRRRARTRLRQYGLAGQAESMDICNEVMADLVRRNAAAEVAPEAMMNYVLRAIDNQVLDTFRSLARQCRDFRRNEPLPDSGSSRLEFGNNATTPSQIALHREVIEKVREGLGKDAVAIDMLLEGCGWAEIGRTLGVPSDTARMRIRRGIQRVRDSMGFAEEEDTDAGGVDRE